MLPRNQEYLPADATEEGKTDRGAIGGIGKKLGKYHVNGMWFFWTVKSVEGKFCVSNFVSRK